MEIKYACPKWPMMDRPFSEFMDRLDKDRFAATEIFFGFSKLPPQEVIDRNEADGIDMIAQISTEGKTVSEHLDQLQKLFDDVVSRKPVLINSQTGRDFLSFDDNLKIFEKAEELSKQAGIPLCHETHRGRVTSNILTTLEIIKAFPDMKFTADISHWVCVHESDLSFHEEHLEKFLPNIYHMHARVGFDQGPQVPNPFTPKYKPWTERHMEIWKRIIKSVESRGRETFYITPEFGPEPYAQFTPFEEKCLCDAWTLNEEFCDYLKENL